LGRLLQNLEVAFKMTNTEVDQLLRQLTAVTGESLTDALIAAVRERLARERRIRGAGGALSLEQAIDNFAQRAVVDESTDDEVLGYDDAGLPS
jgi:antitoxin VapB